MVKLVSGGTPTPFPPDLNIPTAFTMGAVTSSSILVSWVEPAQGTAIGYRVYDGSHVLQATAALGDSSVTVVGLDPNTAYTFHVVSYDNIAESGDSNTDTTTTDVAEVWQLATEYYYPTPAPFNPVFISIRPDSETTATVRYRNAYPDMQYRHKVTIYGGSYPGFYELVGTEGVAYPTGMAIGGTYGTTAARNADYGIITWTPTAGNLGEDWTIVVRYTDQDGRIATRDTAGVTNDASFSLNVNTTGFIFFDIGDAGSLADGSITEPYNAYSQWLGAGVDTSGKILVWRAGTYNPYKMEINNNNDPIAHIWYPADIKPIIIMTKGNMNFTDGTNSHDVYVSGLNIKSSFHYESIEGVEANTSITDNGSGVYRVNKPGHGYGANNPITAIVEDGTVSGRYRFSVSGIGLAGTMDITARVRVTGATPNDFNGIWTVSNQSGSWFEADGFTTGLTATVLGTAYFDVVSLYDVTPAGLNGDYSIDWIDIDNFDIVTAAGLGNASAVGNSALTKQNSKNFFMKGGSSRWFFWENDFEDFDFGGYATGDNPTAIWQPSGATGMFRSISLNTFTNFTGKGTCFTTYDTDYWVYERNLVDGKTQDTHLFPKVANSHGSHRDNHTINSGAGVGLGLTCSNLQRNVGDSQFCEFCYNSNDKGDVRIDYDNANTYEDQYVYRNTNSDSNFKSLGAVGINCLMDDNIAVAAMGGTTFTEGSALDQNYFNLTAPDFVNITNDLTLSTTGLTTISRTRGEVGHEIIAGNR